MISASVEALREKLREEKKEKFKKFKSEDVIDLFELTFMEYGWTPRQVFSMPIPTFFGTIEALSRRKEKEVKAMKSKKGRKK